ncbi:hypothetical protein I5M32_15755 [Pedobacter sp. SD-b]|uniref:CarboxypepD_reg-like domain-containing protein n=1 Tax=Pedobacter segetis TaxID=2793069 RepID=A0ABS1BNF1_9SPHI|nr:hypothetical protein [Pedobacter segetis]
MIGLSIVIKGPITGTNTDLNGQFIINIPQGKSSTLVFNYIG